MIEEIQIKIVSNMHGFIRGFRLGKFAMVVNTVCNGSHYMVVNRAY